MTQFDEQYKQVLYEVMNKGAEVYSKRQNCYTKALAGVVFNLDEGFPLLTLRKIPIKLFVAEQIWFLMGERDPDVFLKKFTKIWHDFSDEDGKVLTAYGYRWRRYFDKDQIKALIDLLTKDPSSRHGVVVAWDPGDDIRGIEEKKKNVPCPYTFTVNIIANKLHLHLIIRSNDLILGCPHDVAGFALLQRILAAKLDVRVGKLTVSISNAHIYDTHYRAAWELIERNNDHSPIMLEGQEDWFEKAERGDEFLTEKIINELERQYKPMPSIQGLKIVL
ncbi:MAG: thymidylate synthase [Patescibacteria group bacterium]|nr:thymidylate synthase [Patescibacteria group bacterium]